MGHCTQEQAAEILAHFERQDQWRKDQMPTEEEAIRVWFEAWKRLKELGWSEAIYCPKDGSEFLALEPGSTGKHVCVYQGEWPTGSWWIIEPGDMSPSHPALWKPAPPKDKPNV